MAINILDSEQKLGFLEKCNKSFDHFFCLSFCSVVLKVSEGLSEYAVGKGSRHLPAIPALSETAEILLNIY